MKEIRLGEFWEGFYKKTSDERIPFKVSFELTYGCNLRCCHCYIVQDLAKRKLELTTEEVYYILDQLVEAGCFHLNFTGGEPLTRPDFFKILDYAKRKGFYIILLTNATLITPRIAEMLKDLDINEVSISLYGITSQTYERITQVPGSFTRCLNGIQLLQQRNIIISIKMMVMTFNLDEFARVESYVKDLGVRFEWDYLIHPRLDGSKEPLRYRIPAEEAIGMESKYLPNFFEEKKASSKDNSFFYCDAGKNSLSITPYGEMNICLEYRFPQYDLRKGNVREGWKEVVNYVKSTNPTSIYQCRDCELQEFCQWCPSAGWLEKRDRGACSPYYKELAMIRKKGL